MRFAETNITHMPTRRRLLLGAAVAAVLVAGLAGCGPSDEQSSYAALYANGTAVPDPDNNPRWVSDCAVLLSVRDTLAGDAVLNWNADTSVEEWAGLVWIDEGLWVLRLHGQGLAGEVPAGLGQLPALEKLHLSENRLTGPIPPELGQLTSLEVLFLYDNRLTGTIPAALGQLTNLEGLLLDENRLTGAIPWEIGHLPNLELLGLTGNDLSGCIPPLLLRLLRLGPNLEPCQEVPTGT